MNLRGQLIAESPIYQGNMRKTLFTRDGDGSHRLVSLAGQIEGTAQALMDAFIGQSRNGRNIGLLNRLWQRLYGSKMPARLITRVTCQLQTDYYPRDHFFDLRMGLRLDEDRWAIESNANYKMETLLRRSVFDLVLQVDDKTLAQGDNQARLYYLLEELRAGRFWFGAGKTKGLGRLRLVMDLPFSSPEKPPAIQPNANHLRLRLDFHAGNPVLVGWNWGKVEPGTPAFAAIEGRLLVEAMRDLPETIRQRLALVIGGPVLSPEDWKQRLAEYLPRVIAIWLREESSSEQESWVLRREALERLGKGKRHALSARVIKSAMPLVDKPFPSREAAQAALVEALGKKANMAGRILDAMEQVRSSGYQLNQKVWQTLVDRLGFDPGLAEQISPALEDENQLIAVLKPACDKVLPQLYLQVDQQVHLLQSDPWVDSELAEREEHLRIKEMLLNGQIDERQWGDYNRPPEGITPRVWRDFVASHSRVRYHHMVNPRNLRKSINNDRNFIAFLRAYRERVRQELAQPGNVDFRMNGPSGREVSRAYGKPYDTVFMRMLSWAASSNGEEGWEIYIPGSTLKGAFRKRATMVLRTLWGESGRTRQIIERLFGREGQRGLVFFSDAYLTDPFDPERTWCSMDGVKMNPHTGRPLETAKRDFLFAYGHHLRFRFQLDMEDLGEEDLEALAVLAHLVQDFQRGDIVIGGEKTAGMGWVEGTLSQVEWLTGSPEGVGQTLFGDRPLSPDGVWQRLDLEDEDAQEVLASFPPLMPANTAAAITQPVRTGEGYISHRAFGGHCGLLVVEAEVLTPLHIQESGEPSYRAHLVDGPVNGWDFFSMAPPEAAHRPEARTYALPSLSLRGMLRHIYTIASDARQESQDIGRLNPADHLFGWVGNGPNQALTGRLSVGFGLFQEPTLAWFKVPYPYGAWTYAGGAWQQRASGPADALHIAGTWRLFPHRPLAPIAVQQEDFQPDTAQANYFRAILPGSRARFTIRFWNLEDEELRRLLWVVALEPDLAHKMGKHRYLGFGSLRFHIQPQSHLVDWAARYAGAPEERWQQPLDLDAWLDPNVVRHYRALREALHAGQL